MPIAVYAVMMDKETVRNL